MKFLKTNVWTILIAMVAAGVAASCKKEGGSTEDAKLLGGWLSTSVQRNGQPVNEAIIAVFAEEGLGQISTISENDAGMADAETEAVFYSVSYSVDTAERDLTVKVKYQKSKRDELFYVLELTESTLVLMEKNGVGITFEKLTENETVEGIAQKIIGNWNYGGNGGGNGGGDEWGGGGGGNGGSGGSDSLSATLPGTWAMTSLQVTDYARNKTDSSYGSNKTQTLPVSGSTYDWTFSANGNATLRYPFFGPNIDSLNWSMASPVTLTGTYDLSPYRFYLVSGSEVYRIDLEVLSASSMRVVFFIEEGDHAILYGCTFSKR